MYNFCFLLHFQFLRVVEGRFSSLSSRLLKFLSGFLVVFQTRAVQQICLQQWKGSIPVLLGVIATGNGAGRIQKQNF